MVFLVFAFVVHLLPFFLLIIIFFDFYYQFDWIHDIYHTLGYR